MGMLCSELPEATGGSGAAPAGSGPPRRVPTVMPRPVAAVRRVFAALVVACAFTHIGQERKKAPNSIFLIWKVVGMGDIFAGKS